MNIEKVIESAIGLFDEQVAAIQVDLQKAVKRSVDERTRDAGENAQKHPLLSSTTLKESRKRANATVARLEQKHGPTLEAALAKLASIAFAKEYVAHIERAIELEQGDKREKDETGLYAAARKAVDRMYVFGTCRSHWAQQSDLEIKIYNDLVRWKAEKPLHDDVNSPWPSIFEMYKQRLMRSDLMGKLELSLPRNPQPGYQPAATKSQIPTIDEMMTLAGEWALYSTSGVGRRTEGVGRLTTDDPYGGFLRRRTQQGAMAMQDREDLYVSKSDRLGAEHWHRFDVPRSTYAVVEMRARFDFPDLPQLYPPLTEIRLLGVTLNYNRERQRELEEAEAGEGPSEILFETVRASFLKHNKCHDEDLIRFWLFLLVGRKYPERVDALFPVGYFHGVRGPDIHESRESPTHFQLVRVAPDRNYRHRMRHPDYGPWADL